MSRGALAPARDLDHTADMAHGLLAFVGRQAERAALREALDAARAGHGGTWLLTGASGIGKSRLLDEIARDAAGAGFTVLWGRCWEAGGAPAFWPWIQILRDVLRGSSAAMLAGPRAPYLVQLVPELRDRLPALGEPPPLSGDSAQFMLLDSVAGAVCDAARAQPLLLALEDLHVASPSSLLVLDFLAQHVRGVPLLVVGTAREAETRGGETEQLLQRIAQTARTIPLAPLRPDEVSHFVAGATGREPSAMLIDTVAARTEGNPLFLVELCRLMIARGTATDVPSDVVPPTLRTALQRRLACLSEPTRAVLEQAAVVGRDFALARLVGAFAAPAGEVHAAIAEAERAAIVVPAGDGAYRFAHISLREVLHQDLDVARRQALHLQIARWLETYGADGAALPWSEIAHHYFAAGEDGREAAIDATERAARQAVSTLAFAEAIASYRAALQAVDLAPVRSPRRRAELMIGLGHAQLHGGDPQAGRDTCLAAAALVRELDAPELLAGAALELGSVLTFGKVDPMLVALLEDALRGLGATHDRLRARVLARLAAAMQPAATPREPIELALQAVALARTTGDRRTLLATLGSASSAMVDNLEAAERVPLDREHVALAAALEDHAEQLRGQVRLALGTFELGDLTAAHAAADAIRALGARLAHPFYGWRGAAIDATIALWEGRFADAERAIAHVRELGIDGGDPNVAAVLAYQTCRLARLTGRREALRTALVRLSQLFTGTPITETLARVYTAAQGLPLAPAVPVIDPQALALAHQDRASFESVAELAAATGDRGTAEALLGRLAHDRSRCVTSGVVGMTWDAPLARVRGLLERTLGRLDDAIASMTTAADACRELGGRPMLAWTYHELAALHLERARGDDRARAHALLDEADAIACELGMGFVRERVERARPASPSAPRAPGRAESSPVLELVRFGELWTVRYAGTELQLRDTKGVRYLARLVAEPGRELHVLDLADALDTVDAGDAGELIDPRARDAYRARVRGLEERLADAEARNDLGAAARASEELEHLQAELGRALGLGGRARRAGAAAERARINVQRRLRSAIAQIGAHDAALARHLERSIRTGVFCCYEPA